MGSNPAAVRVFRSRPPKDLRQWFRNNVRSSKGLVFIMGSKGNGKHFVGPGFAWHGLESCCCSGVSEPASKARLAPMVSEPASHRGCRTKALFFMGSKGNGKHFVGLRFAWHGLESCCCSGVSEPASKRLAPMVSELRPQLAYSYCVLQVRVALVCVVLLYFAIQGCDGLGAGQKHWCLSVPKVRGSILWGRVLLGMG